MGSFVGAIDTPTGSVGVGVPSGTSGICALKIVGSCVGVPATSGIFALKMVGSLVGCPATSGILALNIVGSEVGLGIARPPGEVCPG